MSVTKNAPARHIPPVCCAAEGSTLQLQFALHTSNRKTFTLLFKDPLHTHIQAYIYQNLYKIRTLKSFHSAALTFSFETQIVVTATLFNQFEDTVGERLRCLQMFHI